MINEEKVKYMTKAAVYENGPEKKNISIDGYFRSDYLGLQLVKSALAYTAAFCILTAIWGMSRMEEITLKLSQSAYLNHLIKILIILFAAGLILYEIAVYIYYSKKYESAKQSVKGFHAYLKKIHKFYETEESVEEKKTDEENGL
mgnify:FL=1